jgi:hypothetical protein
LFSIWTQHLKDDPETKERFENEVKGSKRVLDRLIQIIDDRIELLDHMECSTDSYYEVPSWSHLQAHRNGNRSSLVALKKIIDLDQQTEKTDDRSIPTTPATAFPRTSAGQQKLSSRASRGR